MLTKTVSLRVFVSVEAVDFRRGFDGLASHAREGLHREVLEGGFLVFTNRRRNHPGLRRWDYSGRWVPTKRLERNTFDCPRAMARRSADAPGQLTAVVAGLQVREGSLRVSIKEVFVMPSQAGFRRQMAGGNPRNPREGSPSTRCCLKTGRSRFPVPGWGAQPLALPGLVSLRPRSPIPTARATTCLAADE